MIPEYVLAQIAQPCFFYSVVLLVISLVCVKLLLRCCSFLGRARRLAYLVPLFIPVFVLLVFNPTSVVGVSYGQTIKILDVAPPSIAKAASFPEGESYVAVYNELIVENPSITGIACLVGLAAAVFVVCAMLFGGNIMSRSLHIVELEPCEYPKLQEKVQELSERMGVATPRVSLAENLRPNAFTTGYGRNATLVFTVGILDALSDEELTAVACHELAHIKNRDFLFKTLCSGLTALSFFNPFAYIAYAAAQKERELRADERSAKTLEEPAALGRALTKISLILQTMRPEPLLSRVSSSLFFTSSILSKPRVLATHPSLNQRLAHIAEAPPKSKPKPTRVVAGIFLFFLIVFAGFETAGVMVSLQEDLASHVNPQDIFMPYQTQYFSPSGSADAASTVKPLDVSFNVTRETLNITK
jgi:Zn-dependent protease with chaperone function